MLKTEIGINENLSPHFKLNTETANYKIENTDLSMTITII